MFSALKPRRTRIDPYPAAATARANRISKATFQGFMSTSPVPSRHDLPGLEIPFNDERLAATQKAQMGSWRTSNVGAEFRNPGRRSAGLLIGGIVVRPPEPREAPAEVNFEGAPNPVPDITNLRTARLRPRQGQQWEEQVDARLKLRSCRRPEPINLCL